jgi:hypothetical protein
MSFAHGSWAIERQEENDYLVAFNTQLAHTMQPPEFEATVRVLSRAADNMEKKPGGTCSKRRLPFSKKETGSQEGQCLGTFYFSRWSL